MISNKGEMTSSRPNDKSLEDVTPTRLVKSHQMIFETYPYVQQTKKLSLKSDLFCEKTLKKDVTKMSNITLMCNFDYFEKISLNH